MFRFVIHKLANLCVFENHHQGVDSNIQSLSHNVMSVEIDQAIACVRAWYCGSNEKGCDYVEKGVEFTDGCEGRVVKKEERRGGEGVMYIYISF